MSDIVLLASDERHVSRVNTDPDDWRRMGQEVSLVPGTRLVRKRYRAYRETWEHDHCSFCSAKFMDPSATGAHPDEGALTEGYTTTSEFKLGAEYEWVCLACYADFSEEFGFVEVAPT